MSFISYKQIKLKIILALLQQLMFPKHELYMTIPISTRWYYLGHYFHSMLSISFRGGDSIFVILYYKKLNAIMYCFR